MHYHNGHDKGVLFSDLKYAIRVNEIIKAIENTYTIANDYKSNIVFLMISLIFQIKHTLICLCGCIENQEL